MAKQLKDSPENLFSPGKLLFLAVATLALLALTSLNQFSYLFLFVPFPIALAFAYYGRQKGGLAAIGTFVMGSVFLSQATVDASALPVHIGIYAFSLTIAWIVGEIVMRDIQPRKAILNIGLILLALVYIAGSLFLESNRTEYYDLILNYIEQWKGAYLASDDQVKHQLANELLKEPKELTDMVLNMAPSVIFTSIYVWFWLTLFLVLRGSSVLKKTRSYPFSTKDLAKFKAPDHMIWAVIVSLALMLAPADWFGPKAEVYGSSMIQVFGVFYFFQGFGIYLDLLDHLKVQGFLRSFLIVITFFFGNAFLAYIGMFDMWVNFRKFFKRNNKNNGEQL